MNSQIEPRTEVEKFVPRICPDPSVKTLPRERLEMMHDAASDVLQCQHVLNKSGMSAVSEVLRGQGDFLVWERYPKGDVFDTQTHSHYFYHSHAAEEMAEGENGHFHLFVRAAGSGTRLEPWDLPGASVPDDPQDRFIHLCAISMDARGVPLRLFTTNRWVTNETMYRAEDVIPLLDGFAIEMAHPNWAVNQWLTAMVRLHHPQIEDLLRQRDAAIEEWAAEHPDSEVLEDRRLQNISEIPLDVAARVAAIEDALGL